MPIQDRLILATAGRKEMVCFGGVDRESGRSGAVQSEFGCGKRQRKYCSPVGLHSSARSANIRKQAAIEATLSRPKLARAQQSVIGFDGLL